MRCRHDATYARKCVAKMQHSAKFDFKADTARIARAATLARKKFFPHFALFRFTFDLKYAPRARAQMCKSIAFCALRHGVIVLYGVQHKTEVKMQTVYVASGFMGESITCVYSSLQSAQAAVAAVAALANATVTWAQVHNYWVGTCSNNALEDLIITRTVLDAMFSN